MKKLAYWNGLFVEEEKIHLSMDERSFLFGDGLFTTIKVAEGHPEFLCAHLARLTSHCETLQVAAPVIDPAMIDQLIDCNQAYTGTYRLKIIVTGGDSKRLHLPKRVPGHVIITLKEEKTNQRETLSLGIYPTPIGSPTAQLKTLAYLDRLWIKEQAIKEGYDDMITVDHQGHLLEASFSNLFWYADHAFFTPNFTLPLLTGITIKAIEKIAEEWQAPFRLVKAKMEAIPLQALVFMCNSMRGLCPVIQLANRYFKRNLAFELKLQKSYKILTST